MALPTFNTKSPTIKRILKEAAELSKNPDPTLHAAPLETDLFEWHFTIRGPPSTPYAAGAYHGRIVLPQQYPLRPPSFRFLTPSGRFEPNREICLSISGHHEETWQPAWGIRTALWALRAFMEGGAKGQVGGMEMGEAERKRLAEASRSWKCTGCGGRSNDEILRAQQDEGGMSSEGAVVPDELKFGYKDELRKDEKDETPQSERSEAQQTDNVSTKSENNEASTSSIEPQKGVSESTSTSTSNPMPSQMTPMSSAPPPSLQPTVTVRPGTTSQEAVPAWVDKAIIGIIVTLIVIILKKLM